MKPVYLEGIKEIKFALSQLEPKIAKKVVRKAMRPAMKQHIQKEVKANAPKETGELRKAISIKAAKRSRKYIGIDVLVGLGKENFYHAFQEYGTSKMPPKGFMRKALDQNADKANVDVIATVKQMIEKETNKA